MQKPNNMQTPNKPFIILIAVNIMAAVAVTLLVQQEVRENHIVTKRQATALTNGLKNNFQDLPKTSALLAIQANLNKQSENMTQQVENVRALVDARNKQLLSQLEALRNDIAELQKNQAPPQIMQMRRDEPEEEEEPENESMLSGQSGQVMYKKRMPDGQKIHIEPPPSSVGP